MAPKRRTASAQQSRASSTHQQAQQSKLSFSNRVTKASTADNSRTSKTSAKKAADLLDDTTNTPIQQEDIKASQSPEPKPQTQTKPAPDPLSPTTTPDQTTVSLLGGRAPESGLDEQTESSPLSDSEVLARKIPEAQIKKYWRAKEEARLAPRVHQGELGLYEKVLREWDVSGEFGPCIGLPRLQRWKRANSLGLEPPIEVLAILLRQMDDEGEEGKGQRAYVDDLMNSHGRVDV